MVGRRAGQKSRDPLPVVRLLRASRFAVAEHAGARLLLQQLERQAQSGIPAATQR
jgi:hypothetical protein